MMNRPRSSDGGFGSSQIDRMRWKNQIRPKIVTPAAIAPVIQSPSRGARCRSKASSGKRAMIRPI